MEKVIHTEIRMTLNVWVCTIHKKRSEWLGNSWNSINKKSHNIHSPCSLIVMKTSLWIVLSIISFSHSWPTITLHAATYFHEHWQFERSIPHWQVVGLSLSLQIVAIRCRSQQEQIKQHPFLHIVATRVQSIFSCLHRIKDPQSLAWFRWERIWK